MPDVQEVFRMATQKVRPEPGFVDRQLDNQRRRARNRRNGAIALVAIVALAATVIAIRALDGGTGTQPGGQRSDTSGIPSAGPIRAVTNGPLVSGRYVIYTLDPDVNVNTSITIDVPEGYEGRYAGSAVLKTPTGYSDTGVILFAVGYSFADACNWRGTLSPISSADELVSTLADQRGLRPSPRTDVMVGGYAGTYMELTVPAQTKLDRCSAGRMQGWALTDDARSPIWLNNAGQHDLLWILDVNGVPLVIDASLAPSASPQDRAELLQMVESIQIDPR
jgi:hypothetical protein